MKPSPPAPAERKTLVNRVSSHFRREKPCQHPEDQRWVFSGMGVEDWTCKVCGYHHQKPLKEVQDGQVCSR